MAERFTIPTCGDIIAGKYLIQEFGRGSYGVVFRARQLGVERDVAIKTLLPQAFLQTDIVERFQREASLISRLQHPHIVALYDFGESDGLLYMVMEFVRGRSLAQILREEAPLPPARATHLCVQILQALQVAHDQGIVHRDLKPENILLCRVPHGPSGAEEPDFVKILDFGIAKFTRTEQADAALKTLTVQGYVLGTPFYMAPEVITGQQVSHRADLYAVGILLYEMLTGTHPFHAVTPSAVLVRHLHDPVPSLPDPGQARGALGYAVRRALAKDPEERFASAADFVSLLEGRTAPKRAPRSIPWMLLAGAAFLLFCVVASAAALYLALLPDEGAPGEADLPQGRLLPGPTRDAASAAPDPALPPDAGLAAHAPDAGPSAPPAPDAGLVLDFSADAGQDSDAPGPPPQAPGEEPAPQNVRVRFASEPTGAQVKVNGAFACETPCSRSYPTNQRLQVTLSLVGYKAESRSLALEGRNQDVRVKLKPGRLRLVP